MDRISVQYSSYADFVEAAGRKSGNPVFEDFAVLGSLYIRAYVESLPTYSVVDSWLVAPGFRPLNANSSACQAVEG